MTLRTLSKKLRHAADVLDELLEIEGTPAIAKKIIANLPTTTTKRKYTKRRKMDAAARRAVGRRMKLYWRNKRKAEQAARKAA